MISEHIILLAVYSIIMLKITQESLLGVKIKDYTFLRLIGEGNYGRVYEVFNEKKQEPAAAKVMPKEIFKKTPKLMELVKTEIRVLKECKNDNVVRYVDNFLTERSVVIVMEICEGGQLQDYLNRKGRLTEPQAVGFLKQILNGFKGLHEVEAMHRDFKAANVLLHHNVCKIADLGFAKQVKEESMTTTILGTGLTMAPEVHQQKAYGRKADIWSVGVVFYQLIYGDYPFKGLSDHDILQSIRNNRPNYSKVNISDKARDFIDRCLTVDPKARISWKEVYSHPLILEENKIVYGMTSSIKLHDNQIFYDRDSLPQEEMKMEIEKEEVKEEWTSGEEEAVAQAKLEELRAEREEKGRAEQAIKEYQAEYLSRRNGIMFIFKEMVPCILHIRDKIHANHSITLFILCKRAYHDICLFEARLRNGQNFLGLPNYFDQFRKSKQHQDIYELVESDCDLIQMQTHQYCAILPKSLNEATRKEMNLQVIANPNWLQFVDETVGGYEYQLVGDLDNTPPQLKQGVIKLVEGLHYYRTHGHEARVEEFDKYMEGLSYEDAEVRLRERWLKRLTECQ